MKKIGIFIMTFIFVVLLMSTSTITAEKVYDGSSDYKVENILLGNPGAKFETLDGTPLLMAQFDPNTTELKPDEINDGNVDRFQSVIKVNQTGLKSDPGVVGWAIFDLGETHYVEEIRTSFWNDWAFVDVVMQFASDENFTQDVVTVYNNDTDNSVGQGFGTDGVYSDAVDKTQNIHISARGRYFRVTNKGNGQSYSLFTEIQLYGITEGVMPAASTVPSGAYLNDLHVELFAGEGLEEIRYTLDGSIPTKKSTLYTGAFEIEMPVGGGIYLLRTVAYYQDGTVSYPKSYTYKFGFEGNAAYGKGAKLMDYSWNEIEGFAFNSDGGNPPGSPATVTDGAINPWSVYATKENVLGWAVVDFGDVYSINEVRVKAYHDWKFRNVIIQLSTEADFSANVYTVFNNDTTNTVGQGVGIDGAYQEYSFELRNIFSFDPVQARYIRFTNDASVHEGKTISLFEEIQAFSVLGVEAPAEVQPILNVKTLEDLKVNITTTKAEVIAQLPTTVELVDAKNNEFTVEGTWDSLDYNGDEVGNYRYEFKPSNLSDSIFDFFDLFYINIEVQMVDKTLLDLKIVEAELLEEVNYTILSWLILTESLSEAIQINQSKKSNQTDVDSALLDLEKAISSLILRGNKNELNNKIEDAKLIDVTLYTLKTKESFLLALNNAKVVANDLEASQLMVDNALNKLNLTILELEFLGDKTQLQQTYNQAISIGANNYTIPSWAALLDMVDEAKIVLDDEDASQDKVSLVLANLLQAIEELKEAVDKSNLVLVLEEAKTIKINNYTPETNKDLLEYIVIAESIITDLSVSQLRVNEVSETLTRIMSGLIKVADKDNLNQEIKNRINQTGYTVSSFNEYQIQLNTAIAISNNLNASQDEVDEAKFKLVSARENLVKIGDKTTLNLEIQNAKNIDINKYDSKKIEKLQEIIKYAEKISNSNDVDQNQINETVELLNTMINSLDIKTNNSIGIIVLSIGILALITSLMMFFIKKKGVKK